MSKKTKQKLSLKDSLVTRAAGRKSKKSKDEIKRIAKEVLHEYADVFKKLAK